jgi:hypothetical protein
MYEKDDCLVIQLAFSRDERYHDEDREGPFMGKREYRQYKYKPRRRVGFEVRDSEGVVHIGYVRKVYRSGMKSRVVSLPSAWVQKHQNRVGKDLHYVDITIRDELWVKPHFFNLPLSIYGVPVIREEYVPELARKPFKNVVREPPPEPIGPLTADEQRLAERLTKSWKKCQGELYAGMSAKQRRLMKERF